MVQKGVSLEHKNKVEADRLETAVNSPSDNGETYLTLAVSRSVVLLHLLEGKIFAELNNRRQDFEVVE